MSKHSFRRSASRLAAAAVACFLTPLAVALSSPSAAATDASPSPECVHFYPSWRYTSVLNGCDTAVVVAVQYTHGQLSPCQAVQAGAWMTFPGYGTDMNYVTGLLTCDRAAAPTGSP